MKKILVVTTKFPFPLFSGDKLRIYNIFKYLSKKNKVDLIYTGPCDLRAFSSNPNQKSFVPHQAYCRAIRNKAYRKC